MERRMRRHGHCSPERFRGRDEQPPPSPPTPPTKQLQFQYRQTHQHHRQRFREGSKIPVVYYICSDRHLEQPHFVEVPISSSEGLYLKDVINRLNVLRGKGMAAMYSWSCKRSYKNGFVWHDLSVDDLILPAHGNEYVLKGSDLLDASLPEHSHQSTSGNHKLQNSSKQHLPQQEHKFPSRNQDSSQCSIRHEPPIPQQQASKTPLRPPPLPQSSSSQEDELCSTSLGQSRSSNIDDGSPALVEFRVNKPGSASDASTQTDERSRVIRRKREDDNVNYSSSSLKERSEIDKGDISPPTSSSTSSSGGKTETLESLIRADALKTNSFRIPEDEEVLLPTGTKVKATNVLMQLITCGSISVKGHQRFGIVPTYKPRFSNVNIFPSPMFRSTMTLGELDCLSDSSRFLGLSLKDKECFSGSLIETKEKEVGQVCTLKRSSSYNSNRNCRSPETTIDNNVDSRRSKCLPRTIKISSSKQSKNDNVKSPISDCRRISYEGPSSKRFADTSKSKGPSMRLESFKEDKEKNVIKIDERLTSGARITIQSTATCDDNKGSSGS